MMNGEPRLVAGPGGAVSVVTAGAAFENRLRFFFQHLYDTSDFYRGVMKRDGLSPAMSPLALLQGMPPTGKREYREILQWEALAQLNAQPFICDFSSGSTAACVLRFSTWIDELAEQEITEAVFRRAGMGRGDRFVCMEVGVPEIYDFYFRAARRLGVGHTTYLHITGHYAASIQPLRDLAPTVVLTLPSLLVRAWPHMRRFWPRGQSPIRVLIHMGEAMDPGFRREVMDGLDCEIFSFYGATEIGGMAGECRAHAGCHFDPALICPTVEKAVRIDDGTVEGEGLFTSLHFRTQPVVKYRVGDRVRLTVAPCPCGEPGPRLTFVGRTHDSFILTGCKFHYDMILEAVRGIVPKLQYMQIRLSDVPEDEGNTRMELLLPAEFESRHDAILQLLREGIFELDSEYRYGFVSFAVRFLPGEAFAERKIVKVTDNRRYIQ